MKPRQHVTWKEGKRTRRGEIESLVYGRGGQLTGVKIVVGNNVIYRDVKRKKILGEVSNDR